MAHCWMMIMELFNQSTIIYKQTYKWLLGQQNAFQEFMDDQLGFDPGGGGIYRAFGLADGQQTDADGNPVQGGGIFGGINPGIVSQYSAFVR